MLSGSGHRRERSLSRDHFSAAGGSARLTAQATPEGHHATAGDLGTFGGWTRRAGVGVCRGHRARGDDRKFKCRAMILSGVLFTLLGSVGGFGMRNHRPIFP